MKEKANRHIMKIKGQTDIPQKLDSDGRYIITVEADVTDVHKRNCHEIDDQGFALYDYIYSCKQTGQGFIVKPDGKKIYTKGKKTPSELQRGALWAYHHDQNIEQPFAEWYPRAMAHIRVHTTQIMELMKVENKHE